MQNIAECNPRLAADTSALPVKSQKSIKTNHRNDAPIRVQGRIPIGRAVPRAIRRVPAFSL